jgi:hypothetical protein
MVAIQPDCAVLHSPAYRLRQLQKALAMGVGKRAERFSLYAGSPSCQLAYMPAIGLHALELGAILQWMNRREYRQRAMRIS